MFNKIRRWFDRPKNPTGFVYYARLKTDQGIYYKIGFTTKSSLAERMAFGGHGDEKLIDQEFIFSYRKDAWDVEQTLLGHFANDRVFGMYSNDPTKPLNGRGQSELFTRDILGMDEDLYRLSDRDMESLKEDVSESNSGCLMIIFGLILVPFTLGFSLFFIVGGLSGIFGERKSVPQFPKRPKHPLQIQDLLDSLVHSCQLVKSRPKPIPLT